MRFTWGIGLVGPILIWYRDRCFVGGPPSSPVSGVEAAAGVVKSASL